MYNFVVITRAALLTSLEPETPDLGEKGQKTGKRQRKQEGKELGENRHMKGQNTKRYEKRNTKEFKPGISYYLKLN